MKLLILLNGYKENLFEVHRLNPAEFEIIKADDKDLAKPGTMIRMMKQRNFEKVYFGCRELKLQRFQIFMKIYAFLAARDTEIIDETGNKNKHSFPKFLFAELPALLLEIILSAFAVIFYHIKYPLDKWIFMKKH